MTNNPCDTLKACPICGSQPSYVFKKAGMYSSPVHGLEDKRFYEDAHYLRCRTDGHVIQISARTKDEVYVKWNTRHHPSQKPTGDAIYSPDQERVAKFLCEETGIGGGDDPIGFLIASHRELARQRNELREKPTGDRMAGLERFNNGYCEPSGDGDLYWFNSDEAEIIRTAISQPDASVLVKAAQAVIDRWDTPNWKEAFPTACFMEDLRRAIATYNHQTEK